MADSTFVVGATTATFRALIRGHSDGGEAPWRRMEFTLKLGGNSAWATLLALRSKIAKTDTPSGTGTVDLLNGPGLGTLTIASYGSGTGYLTSLTPTDKPLPSGSRFAKATFELLDWTSSA